LIKIIWGDGNSGDTVIKNFNLRYLFWLGLTCAFSAVFPASNITELVVGPTGTPAHFFDEGLKHHEIGNIIIKSFEDARQNHYFLGELLHDIKDSDACVHQDVDESIIHRIAQERTKQLWMHGVKSIVWTVLTGISVRLISSSKTAHEPTFFQFMSAFAGASYIGVSVSKIFGAPMAKFDSVRLMCFWHFQPKREWEAFKVSYKNNLSFYANRYPAPGASMYADYNHIEPRVPLILRPMMREYLQERFPRISPSAYGL
jgi:hypothetical protein